jgi:flagellar export protein FliJ
MKRFRFRAEIVLNLRRREYELAQAQLAGIQRERDAAVHAVHEAEGTRALAEGEYRAWLDTGGDSGVLERHRNWITRQHAGVESCRRHLVERELEVERAAADVRRTHRRTRVLERLRERAVHDHRKEARRQDAIEMDHLAVIRYARRTGGGLNGGD